MLQGTDIGRAESVSQAFQDYFLAFVRTGTPNGPGLSAWNSYWQPTRTTMHFDTVTETSSRLSAAGRRRGRSDSVMT